MIEYNFDTMREGFGLITAFTIGSLSEFELAGNTIFATAADPTKAAATIAALVHLGSLIVRELADHDAIHSCTDGQQPTEFQMNRSLQTTLERWGELLAHCALPTAS